MKTKLSILISCLLFVCLLTQISADNKTVSQMYNNKNFTFPEGKTKALIMSFDDGLSQDIQLVKLFNKYHIKGTFNLNSGKIGCKAPWLKDQDGIGKEGEYISNEVINTLYTNHEIASHTLTHPNLTELNKYGMQEEINDDVLYLEKNFGVRVESFAYPFGTNDERTMNALKKAGITNGRTVADTNSFEISDNFLKWDPTCHHSNAYKLIDKFLADKSGKPELFYIWGHSWELDRNQKHNGWKYMESICKKLSVDKNIWSCTAGEFVNYINAVKNLTESNSLLINNSNISVWIKTKNNDIFKIPANKKIELH